MSRIPRRCANKNKNQDKTTSSPSNNSDKNNAKDNDYNRSPSLEESVNLNALSDGIETIPKTPAGCIAARIRSYSALRRSQWKKRSKDCSGDSNKENACCSPAKNMSPLEETGCGPLSTEVENNSDLSSEYEVMKIYFGKWVEGIVTRRRKILHMLRLVKLRRQIITVKIADEVNQFKLCCPENTLNWWFFILKWNIFNSLHFKFWRFIWSRHWYISLYFFI